MHCNSLIETQPFETPSKILVGSAIFATILAAQWSSNVLQYTQWETFFPLKLNPVEFVCIPHHYTTEIVSNDPLLIYINNFTSILESRALIEAG